MTVNVYEISDEDVLDRLVEESQQDSPKFPLARYGRDNGELVFSGSLSEVPDVGDILALEGVSGLEEYVIVSRVYFGDKNMAEIIVHRRTFSSGRPS
jgi:hypothetical protein